MESWYLLSSNFNNLSMFSKSVTCFFRLTVCQLGDDGTIKYNAFAGLVFVPLSRRWRVSDYGEDWAAKAPIGMCHMALNQYPKKADQQLVILSQVIVTELNFGYQDLVNFRVRAVNGVEINNISHLIEVVEESKEEFLTFDIGKFTTIVLDRAKGVAGTQAILESNHIRKNKCVPE
eukprot:481934_1